MRVCILGWYGTETLGDRAILDGLFRIFTTLSAQTDISIGSLYPVVTERTILEDGAFWREHCPEIRVKTFAVKEKKLLRSEILAADWVIMGGGPLMDLSQLFILRYAFRYAKKHGKRTGLIGCGYGPLREVEFRNCVRELARLSDVVIMRSEDCRDRMDALAAQEDRYKITAAMDPAAISAIEYRRACAAEKSFEEVDGTWVMNIRDYVESDTLDYYPMLRKAVEAAARQAKKLILIPMSTFLVGGDDRYIENRIARELGRDNISVVQKPLALKEAYDLARGAAGCIGMRYHSVLFQTFLNGNNYILDYTDPLTGKIGAFLRDVDGCGFYSSRYRNLMQWSGTDFMTRYDRSERFSFQLGDGERTILQYRTLLERVERYR